MTDREMLEFAAKAVGVTLDFSIRGDFPPYYINERGGHSSWNPLTDDGDALRLAVKLRIKFRYNEALGQALAWTGGVTDYEAQANIEDCGRDETACARRAIVRAAAEIGRQMK